MLAQDRSGINGHVRLRQTIRNGRTLSLPLREVEYHEGRHASTHGNEKGVYLAYLTVKIKCILCLNLSRLPLSTHSLIKRMERRLQELRQGSEPRRRTGRLAVR